MMDRISSFTLILILLFFALPTVAHPTSAIEIEEVNGLEIPGKILANFENDSARICFGTHEMTAENTSEISYSKPYSKKITYTKSPCEEGWQDFSFDFPPSSLNLSDYSAISIRVRGACSIGAWLGTSDSVDPTYLGLRSSTEPTAWCQLIWDLTATDVNLSNVTCIAFVMDDEIGATRTFFLDDIELTTAAIYVPDDYPTIQDAVNVASDGDTIIVRDGTYIENVKVYKRLTIQSENGCDNCIVQGGNSNDHVFEVRENYVNIRGFTVEGANGTVGSAGIYLGGVGHCHISNNNASNNDCGILLDDSSSNTLTNNIANNNNFHGIYLYDSSNNSLSTNIAYNNDDTGICLDSSKKNILTKNTVYNNRWNGICLHDSSNNSLMNNIANNTHNGIILDESSSNTLTHNTAYNNGDTGILLVYSSNNMLTNNTVDNNTYNGICLDNSSNNTLMNNIANNNLEGIYLHNSSDNTLTGNIANSNNYIGIHLHDSSDNTLTCNIANSNNWGIDLYTSCDNALKDNTMSGNGYNFAVSGWFFSHFIQDIDTSNEVNGKPIYYWVDQQDKQISNDAGYVGIVNSTNITVKDLTLTNNGQGVLFAYTSNSKIENVTALNNCDGIWLYDSSYNTLTNNTMSGNCYNFGVKGCFNHFIQNIDRSNKVNGKPIYYWVDQQDKQIPNDAGYVGIVNSTNITVKDLTLTNNGQGVLFAYTSNSRIENVTASENYYGIYLEDSSSNTLSKNSNNNNWIFGILLQYSSDNVIVNNCVSNNRERGIHLYNSINNLIYHNNHINNGNQAYDNTDTNLWNSSYPTGGNYWNDYNGSDAYCGPDQNLPGSDGVGDTPYNISGDAGAQDRYPFLNESGWLTGLTTITISPSTKTLYVGEKQWFTATAKDQNGDPVSGVLITWESSNTAVGSVFEASTITDSDGKATTTFTASAIGTITVNATSWTVSGTASMTVQRKVVAGGGGGGGGPRREPTPTPTPTPTVTLMPTATPTATPTVTPTSTATAATAATTTTTATTTATTTPPVNTILEIIYKIRSHRLFIVGVVSIVIVVIGYLFRGPIKELIKQLQQRFERLRKEEKTLLGWIGKMWKLLLMILIIALILSFIAGASNEVSNPNPILISVSFMTLIVIVAIVTTYKPRIAWPVITMLDIAWCCIIYKHSSWLLSLI